jgi:hypothetical protein
MDSKEGALSPRSIRLKKSIEMSRSSENCSCVISRSLRIDRSFFPNCFRRVDTPEVCPSNPCNNTERYYGSLLNDWMGGRQRTRIWRLDVLTGMS